MYCVASWVAYTVVYRGLCADTNVHRYVPLRNVLPLGCVHRRIPRSMCGHWPIPSCTTRYVISYLLGCILICYYMGFSISVTVSCTEYPYTSRHESPYTVVCDSISRYYMIHQMYWTLLRLNEFLVRPNGFCQTGLTVWRLSGRLHLCCSNQCLLHPAFSSTEAIFQWQILITFLNESTCICLSNSILLVQFSKYMYVVKMAGLLVRAWQKTKLDPFMRHQHTDLYNRDVLISDWNSDQRTAGLKLLIFKPN